MSNTIKYAALIALGGWLAAPSLFAADSPSVTLKDFKLTGDLGSDHAAFTLSATAHVEGARGAVLDVLAGPVALTEIGPHPKWRVGVDQNRFVLSFERSGDFPILLKFTAALRQNDGWNSVDFHVAPSTLQPIELRGLAADTQFQFAGAARPDRTGTNFNSFLPADGNVRLAWKEARKEEEGKLFYAAEMLSQISVSPGLMRQVALFDFKVMQGELTRVSMLLRGEGEVVRVQGDQVLAWNVEAVTNSRDRRLVVQLNQPQKDHFLLQVQVQTPLGAFPQVADAMELRPEGGTRFAGYFRIVNDGAVRLEVTQARGLSQISPDKFPEDAARGLFQAGGGQRFAYRFSGADFALKIQADQILPELSVWEVLAYHLGENDQAIDAEIELDIREAPLRELLLHVPKGYVVAHLSAGDFLNDYPMTEPPDGTNAELRLVFGQPISGRQVVQLRLERNHPLNAATWALPRVEVARAKSVRGNVGVAADAGFRLTPERTQGLTDIATAFFPRKVNGLQAGFRVSDPAWDASLRVERLPQTVQADVFHLFSIGEGIAYGSSVMNYVITGSPVSAFKVELSSEYANVEFTGRDVRTWEKTADGYLVQLHTPVAGPYTLLATYTRPFKPQGESLSFTGARPLDARTEQGHTIIVSAYQFKVEPADVSPGLMALEPGEVPADYRLFFDAPILAAYHYSARPFNLRLTLSPLAQGNSLNQVVDRASLTNHISKEGQVLTDARYFVKNRGNSHFSVTLPAGTDLWSAMVNGASVVPVKDGAADLIPLPQQADPNAVLTVDLKLAGKSSDARHLTLAAPKVNDAPVMLAAWRMEPDSGRRLVYTGGSLTPLGGFVDESGFAGMKRLITGVNSDRVKQSFLAAMVLLLLAVVMWRWARQRGVWKFSPQHTAGLAIGLVAFVLGLWALWNIATMARPMAHVAPPSDLTFLAPVQQADKAASPLTIDVLNVPDTEATTSVVSFAWPAVLALVLWAMSWLATPGPFKSGAWLGGWLLVAWATLRMPDGANAFIVVFGAFLILHVALPAIRRLLEMPTRTAGANGAGLAGAPGTAATLSLLLGGLLLGAHSARAEGIGMAESVTQKIRVEEKFAIATAKIHWSAERGQSLPLLYEPAVLTKVTYPPNSFDLVQAADGNRRVQQLVAKRTGTFDIDLQYQVQLNRNGAEGGFALPTQCGLINRLDLTMVNLDVDVGSPQAVSTQRTNDGSNTLATVVLSPLSEARIVWHPRSRDVKREKPVFYAEMQQLYVPSAGVIEGVHYVAIRPAQGELGEMIFNVPAGATITDVLDPNAPAQPATQSQARNQPVPAPLVSLWRFDPDTRKLRVTLTPAQSRPFALMVRSQVATGTLPVEQRVGLLSVEGAAGQIGLLGIATGNEVELDNVAADGFSPINLEDFPAGVGQALAAQIPGLTLRRALRYPNVNATATLKASAVEPDVRVETETRLSLSEDRTLLAADADVEISRAGIFRLSFALPPGMDVESVSGTALSHWTELKTGDERVITLHLPGKTEGKQKFSITLTGPGVKAADAWVAPQIVIREAAKQSGSLLIVPEQGLQLQSVTFDGISPLDPQKSGIRQKGVLLYRVLQAPWNLTLKLEQVTPWVQVTGLQHALINEAQMNVTANLQYLIENAGLKGFRVRLPADAQGVHFAGDQVSDFLASGQPTNGLQEWEVKLQRRVIGQYLLQATYQVAVPAQATEISLRGVQAGEVNSQRGFVTVQSGGRLQLRADAPPSALQPAEWQSIPRVLQQDLQTASASFAFRLVDPVFQLPLKLERHEAAKMLPARVENVTFKSVISDDGVMLTQVRLELLPGDKRLLYVTLPKGNDAQFWFAFVNDNGVWPWKEQDQILIPLEQQSRGSKSLSVEFFYTSKVGGGSQRSLDLALVAPKFDLPLEHITWQVYLNEKWQLARWSGSLQLQPQQIVQRTAALDTQSYLLNEAGAQQMKKREAEQMLAFGNSALQNGDPQQARRAFQAAYGLSQGDQAFNEDARVQLNNLKLQQALVGLNVLQSANGAAENPGVISRLLEQRNRKEVNYTQQDAKDIIDRSTADDNAAFMRVAERLIQQQDAAVSSPAVIHASIPEQGRMLTFERAVVVDKMADLRVDLDATAARVISLRARVLLLGGTLVLLAIFALAGRAFRKEAAARN